MRKRIYLGILLILTVIFIPLNKNLFSARLFYLSSEKTFSQEERARVKLESGYHVKKLRLRVYKIKDPFLFYKNQNQFKRPVFEKREFRKDTYQIATNFYRYIKQGVRTWAREKIPFEGRKNSLDLAASLKGKFRSHPHSPDILVKSLKKQNLELIKNTNYEIPTFNQNWNYHYIFFDKLKSGAYLVEAAYKTQVAYTVLNISNLGFIAKKSENKLLIYTSNNQNSKPIKNVKIHLYNHQKKEIKKSESNSKGLILEDLDQNNTFVIAKYKNNYAFYNPRYYPVRPDPLRVYMYTERPVYRGGDEVFIKGIVRNYKNESYQVVKNENVKIEIVNSKGDIIYRAETKTSKNGSFNNKFRIPEESPGGRYLIVANIKGKSHEAEFKLEYYQKPEFEVKINSDKKLYFSSSNVSATIEAKYYYGDAVKNAQVSYFIYRSQIPENSFDSSNKKDFFLSKAEYFFSRKELVSKGEGVLNAQGELEISFKTNKSESPYYYQIKARVTDSTGVPVSGNLRVKVVPADIQVLISADKFVYTLGEEISLQLKSQDYQKNSFSTNLDIQISTEDRKKNKYIFYDRTVETDSNGNYTVRFKAKKPGFVKIFIEGKDKFGNTNSYEKYLWIGAHGAAYSYSGGLIKMVLDKAYYQPGDTAKLFILSPIANINFLYTLEGDSFYKYQIKKLSKNSAIIRIPIKEKYSPNIFANISFLFNNKYYSNSIQVKVPPLKKMLQVKILPNKKTFEPRGEADVKVQVLDYKGQPVANAEVAVGVVDEAIYAISREIAANIIEYFYHFRKNSIRSWASIGYRFYGYSRHVKENMANRKFRPPTGLAAFKDSDSKDRKKFKDTILWLPSLKTDENGIASFKVPFPDNITKWRITAVATTKDTKVGKSKNHVITRLSFFAKISRPRFINENDELYFNCTVHNLTDKKLTVKAIANAKNLKLIDKQKEFDLNANTVQKIRFKVKAGSVGKAEFSLKVQSKNKYKDLITKKLEITSHSIAQNKNINTTIDKQNHYLLFNLPENLKEGTLKLNLSVASNLFNIIQNALPYLIKYPYGCVEQTTSKFIPLITAYQAMRKMRVWDSRFKQKINKMLNLGLNRLYNFQKEDGSWGWWRKDKANLFMTSYVMYALSLTRKNGFFVNYSVFKKGLESIFTNLKNAKNDTERLYALYVLSLNKRRLPSMMQRLLKTTLFNLDNKRFTNPYDLSLMVLCLKAYGLNRQAYDTAQILKSKVQKDFNGWGKERSRFWYYDNVETTAWAIRALRAVSPRDELIDKAFHWLLSQKRGNRWKSTRDTAAVIFALSDLIERSDAYENQKLSVWLNNKKLIDIRGKRQKMQITLNKEQSKKLRKKQNVVEIRGFKNNNKFFTSVALNYFTKGKKIDYHFAGLSVKRYYYSLKASKDSKGNIKYRADRRISTFRIGEPVLVKVNVFGKKGEYLMLEDSIPAGALIQKDFNLSDIQSLDKLGYGDSIDYRDNKVIFFLTDWRGAKSFYYVLMPVYGGKYKVKPAEASLMYFPHVKGNSDDDQITIY